MVTPSTQLIDSPRWMFVYGTRPEAIKMAPLIKQAQARGILTSVVITGQHKELVKQVNEVFGINPDYDLKVMRVNQKLIDVVADIALGLDRVLREIKPSLVFVQGDTTSAFASALTAFYQNISVAHIEAGLRTRNLNEPFPEEANRCMISQIADYHFAPTNLSVCNLEQSGVTKNIFEVGNTVVDALKYIYRKIQDGELEISPRVKKLSIEGKYFLLTCHRRENFGDPLIAVLKASRKILKRYGLKMVIPVHPNPNVSDIIKKELSGLSGVELLDPVDYPTMTYLLANCEFVITDSGGIQEEAPVFGKPIFVIRERTERPEGINAGCAMIVGVDELKMTERIFTVLDSPELFKGMSQATSPYGDGTAAIKIIDILNVNGKVYNDCK